MAMVILLVVVWWYLRDAGGAGYNSAAIWIPRAPAERVRGRREVGLGWHFLLE